MDGSLSDSAGSDSLLAAVQWLQGTLLGTVATTIAIISVAAIGFMLLTGRIDWRRGVTTIVGCFVLFGASSIVAGIRSAAWTASEDTQPTYSAPTYASAPPTMPTPTREPIL